VLPDEVTKLIPPPKNVEVAVLEAKISPATENLLVGVEVPIPTLPVPASAKLPSPVP
jgi:hypothetical protein